MGVQVDDAFPEHPKVIGLSDAAFRAWVTALCRSKRYLTDGAVAAGWVKPRAAAELVEAGLFEVRDVGWYIHDYPDWQDTREEVLKSRADTRRRVQKHRDKRARNAVTDTTVTPPKRPPSTSTSTTRGSGNSETDRSVGGSGGESRQPTDTQTYLRNRLAEFDQRWVDVTDERLTEAAAQYGSASVLDVLQGARLKADDGTLGMIESPVAWFFVACRKAQGELGVSA